MNYQEAEQFFYSLMNIPREEYLEHAHKGKNFLARLQFFLDIIDNPEKKIPHYIHVTGTSGKGSVCTYLHYILKESKLKTGLYISPHPSELAERWQINGHAMTKKEFTEIIEFFKIKLDKYIRTTPYDMLSFFELDTAIALYYFAKKKVEWAVMEVGMGGRYDSTNVIPYKDVAVITNIGLDHTEILGNTKEKIAYEKAGIIKKGCAVFTMEKNEKVCRVIEDECIKQKVGLRITNYKLLITNFGIDGTDFTYKNKEYHLNTIGEHQVRNAKMVIDIAEYLNLPAKAIKKGLASAIQPLRMEIIAISPLIVLDGAHNPDKIKTTVDTIKQLQRNNNLTMKQFSHVHLVIGFSEDKNIKNMVHQLASTRPTSIACTRNTDNLFRKVAPPKSIKNLFKKNLPNTTKIEIFIDPTDAFQWVKSKAKKNDIILVTGSIFLSGELRRKINITSLPSHSERSEVTTSGDLSTVKSLYSLHR